MAVKYITKGTHIFCPNCGKVLFIAKKDIPSTDLVKDCFKRLDYYPCVKCNTQTNGLKLILDAFINPCDNCFEDEDKCEGCDKNHTTEIKD